MKNIDSINFIIIDSEKLYDCFEHVIMDFDEFWKDEFLKIGAIDATENLPVGIMIFKEEKKSYEIKYLYVDENYRRRGIASGFLDTVQKMATLKIGEIEELVEVECDYFSIYDGIHEFFASRYDMMTENEGNVYYITPEKIRDSSAIKKLLKHKSKDTSISEYDEKIVDYQLKKIIKQVSDLEADDLKDISYDLSQIVEKDGKIVGFLLAKELADEVSLDYIYSKSNDPKVAMYMMSNALKKFFLLYSYTGIRFNLIQEKSKVTNIFPDATPEYGFYVSRWNYMPYVK